MHMVRASLCNNASRKLYQRKPKGTHFFMRNSFIRNLYWDGQIPENNLYVVQALTVNEEHKKVSLFVFNYKTVFSLSDVLF